MQRLHEPTDEAKIAQLQESMESNGWLGCPLVVDGEMLLTGMHRSEAWERADFCENPPTIDIRDLIADYDQQITDKMNDGQEWYDALLDIIDDNSDICNEYGVDLD